MFRVLHGESGSNRRRGSGVPSRRGTAALAVVVAVLAGSALSIGAATPAFAAGFAITSNADGDFVSGRSVSLAGSGLDGSTVTVTSQSAVGAGPGCSADVSGGRWACELPLADGANTVTASQATTAGRGPAPIPDPTPSPTPPPAAAEPSAGGPSVDPSDADPSAADPSAAARSAAPAPTPTPSLTPAAPDSETITLRALGAPTITGTVPIVTNGLLSGSALAGADMSVRARLASGGAWQVTDCPATFAAGFWTCELDLPSGDYRLSARQTSPENADEASPWSAEVALLIDRDAPAAPVISTPASGAVPIIGAATLTGTGEAGAGLEVFGSGALLCRTVVGAGAGAGTWSCVADAPPAGARVVQAVQRDPAGNYSTPSEPLSLVFGSAPSAAPAPSAPDAAAPTPGEADPSSPPSQSSPPSPDSDDGGPSPAPDAPLGPVAGGWAQPTGFGSRLPALASWVSADLGLNGLLFAAVFILLVALPLRLAAPTLAGRFRMSAPRVFGRNLEHRERRHLTARLGGAHLPSASVGADAPPSAPWWRVAVVLGAATLLMALAIGIQGEERYVRLVLAIAIGVVIVNAVGVALVSGAAARVAGVQRRIRIVPTFLAAAAIATLISRAAGIEPPLVIGVVIAASTAVGASRQTAAMLQLAQLAAIGVLSMGAWVLYGIVAPLTGVWATGLAEVLAAICICGFGSLVLLLLPIWSLPGRAVYEWSRLIWVLCAVVAAGLAGAALATGAALTLPTIALMATGVAATCVATWAWVRWVEPALAR